MGYIPLSEEQRERLCEAVRVRSDEALNRLFERVMVVKASEEKGEVDYLEEDPFVKAKRATNGNFKGQLLMPDTWLLKGLEPELRVNFRYVLHGLGSPNLE